jgi:hypothetical protein
LRKVAAITIVPIAFLVEAANVTVPVAVTIVPGSATYTTRARRASLRTIATVAVIPITLLVEAGKLAIPISVT